MIRSKIHSWKTALGILMFVWTILLLSCDLLLMTRILDLRGNPARVLIAIGTIMLIAPYAYLLFSALSHFKTKHAIAFWVGSLLIASVWFVIVLLCLQIKAFWLIALLGFAPILALAITAIVKRDIRYGWGAAALWLGFGMGFGIIITLFGHRDVFFLNPIGCPSVLLGLCVFIAADLALQYRLAGKTVSQ